MQLCIRGFFKRIFRANFRNSDIFRLSSQFLCVCSRGAAASSNGKIRIANNICFPFFFSKNILSSPFLFSSNRVSYKYHEVTKCAIVLQKTGMSAIVTWLNFKGVRVSHRKVRAGSALIREKGLWKSEHK